MVTIPTTWLRLGNDNGHNFYSRICWNDWCSFHSSQSTTFQVREKLFKDTAAVFRHFRSVPCHWCLAHIFVHVHTLLIILPLQRGHKHMQTPLMSTPITHAHTEWEEYVRDKRTRGEKEEERGLMERERLAVGGFLKADWVLSLHDKTVWGGGDTTHSHCYTSANRSALSGSLSWLPGWIDVLSFSWRLQTPFGAMSSISCLPQRVVQVIKEKSNQGRKLKC